MVRINYLKGEKQEFLDFINFVTLRDKFAIISHNDLDGIASALFLEKILESKEVEIGYIDFVTIDRDLAKELSIKFKELGITKVIFCDLNLDEFDFEGYSELRKEIDVFLIDHHPMNPAISEFDKVIKTDSQDCSAMTIFELGEGIFDREAWQWLNCAAIFSDFSYKEEKNFLYLQDLYPNISMENISSSVPGIISRKINSALVYYGDNKKYVYDLVKKRDVDSITEVHEIIEDEIDRFVENYKDNEIYVPEKNLHFLEVDSKFDIASTVVTMISKLKSEDSFVVMQRKDDFVKFSARNQSSSIDMGQLMKRCVEGLDGANGGGHVPAAAAKIQAKDLDEFKRRLLE
ncbi:DHH family phosphoesterase [archaeon]|jgi:single-stranded DNA-specific DHH superfamily exonuclease|nr:DHH family phosphoesterase [archaeon]